MFIMVSRNWLTGTKTMKEGSEGDGGGSSDDVPTSRDADSTVSNGGPHGPSRISLASNALSVHEGLPLGGTTLANALLGIALDRKPTNGANGGDALFGIHSTNTKGAKGSTVDSNGQNRDKVFECPVCNRCFGYKHVLQNHERTHTGEKPFECKECHKRFTRDHHLKTHMRLHTGEKPYHCSHCERQFVQVANLRRHLRVHTGERPYSCVECNSKFSDSNQLKAHRLIHQGIKPFQCLECKGHFRRRHHLVHHKCPKDEANIGKPRRGRRTKAYEESTTLLLSVKQEPPSTPIPELAPFSPQPEAVSLTSVITRKPSPPLVPQPAHMQQARSSHQIMHHPLVGLSNSNGRFRYDAVQTGPLDMTVSSAGSAPVSVIVPRISALHYHPGTQNSTEGVLDLSNSRSDSEAEPIEEEVDEEDDCVDEGLDSEDSDEEEHFRILASSWKQREDDNHLHNHHHHHVENLRRGNKDRYDSGGENSNLAFQLTTS